MTIQVSTVLRLAEEYRGYFGDDGMPEFWLTISGIVTRQNPNIPPEEINSLVAGLQVLFDCGYKPAAEGGAG